MIAVVVAGRVRLYRDGLAEVLARRGGIVVAAAAATATEALHCAREQRPDVLLLDVGGDPSTADLQLLVAALPTTAVVVLGVSEREEDVLAWIEAGAAGYVTRDESIDELAATIESVARGETRCSPRFAATLMRRVAAFAAGVPTAPAAGTRLTAREREILTLIELGRSNKEIGVELQIQLATVKNHVHNILEKLDVSHRHEAAARVRLAPDPDPTI